MKIQVGLSKSFINQYLCTCMNLKNPFGMGTWHFCGFLIKINNYVYNYINKSFTLHVLSLFEFTATSDHHHHSHDASVYICTYIL